MRWDALNYTADWIPNELSGSNDHTAHEQKGSGEHSVQTEDGIIGLNILPLEVVLQSSE